MERIRHPGITPLEVWDLLIDGKLWGELTLSPDFPKALARGVEILRAGGGITRSTGPVPSVVTGFEAVFLAGGRSQEPALCGIASMFPCPAIFAEHGLYSGASGGFAFLAGRGLKGWVADLGGSHLKIVSEGGRWVYPRDWNRLRQTVEVSPAEHPAHRRRLREFISLRLQMAMTEAGAIPASLVFALPARVADDGTPNRSSYAGMHNDRNLLPDALAMAGLAQVPLFVINDAELAALGAILDKRLAEFRKILVLTLGFGIGAALIQRT